MAGMAPELGLNETPHLRLAQDNAPGFFRAYQRLYAAVRHNETTLEQRPHLSACAHLLMERCADSNDDCAFRRRQPLRDPTREGIPETVQ